MNLEIIHSTFQQIVSQHGIYHKIGVPKNVVAQYRWKLKRGIHISIDKKLSIIQAAGVRLSVYEYTDKDLYTIVEYALKASISTRDLGAAYILEKWKSGRK